MRGDVYRLKASPHAKGHEQKGERYAVIVQSDDLPLSTVLAAPTSTSGRPTGFRPRVEIDGVPTLVMVEQTSAIDIESRLGAWAGRLNYEELAEVDRCLLAVLGLNRE